jgi:hypothetical protein
MNDRLLVLILLCLTACIDPNAAEREQVAIIIDTVKFGMSEAEVTKLAGAPVAEEPSPFPDESLPMTPGCKPCEDELGCKLEPAVRRVRYEWRFPKRDGRADVEELEIYCDASARVTCTQRIKGMEFNIVH